MEKQLKDLIAAIDAKRVVGSLDKRIVEVNKSHIVLGPNVSLPIGDLYKDTFMNYINSKFLTK